MKGIGFSIEDNCEFYLIGSYLNLSNKEGNIPLNNYAKQVSEWGDYNDLLSIRIPDDSIVNLNLRYKSNSNPFLNSAMINLNAGDIKGVLIIGLGRQNEIVLWDYTEECQRIIQVIYNENKSSLIKLRNRQYTYKLSYSLENEIALTSTCIKRIDGTRNNFVDSLPAIYQKQALPHKIAFKFIEKCSNFQAYVFFDENELRNAFERFYGAHPETRADFIIRIDAENKKYELALFRQGLKEPVVIPSEAYQLIVFRNKFEDYRSKNYNQPRGAWIW